MNVRQKARCRDDHRHITAQELSDPPLAIVMKGDPALVEGEIKGWGLGGRFGSSDMRTARSSSADARKWCWAHVWRGGPEQVRCAHQCRKAQACVSLIDTLVHEELHILFPRFGETMICAITEWRVRSMSKKEKDRHYARIRGR
jgi:hypothetical protein